MSTQPRGISAPGIHQSQPQLIPQVKFNPQQQLNYSSPHQSFSPRQFAPSSPLHQTFYAPQQNITTGSHDMNKNPGVAGTPPANMMMMPGNYYRQNGQRPRNPVPPANNQPYYQFQPQISITRYQTNPTGPPTSPSYSPYAQYPPFITPQQQVPQQQNQMFSPNYAPLPQYSQPQAPPQHMTPPMQAQQLGPPIASAKREKKIIRIKDPNTNEDLTENILKGANKARQESLSTPPSGRSSATPPNSDIPAQFAAQVMAAASNTGKQSVSPLATNAVMMTQGPQMMQMQTDPQRVGSPSLVNPMMHPPPNAAFANMQQQQQVALSSSPRTQPMMPNMAMPNQLHGYGLPPPQNQQYPPTILSSSPGMPQISPQYRMQMQHPPPEQPQPPAGYQLPPHPIPNTIQHPPQFGTPPMTMPPQHQQPPIRPTTNSMSEHVLQSGPPNVHSVRSSNISSPVPTEILSQPQVPPSRPVASNVWNQSRPPVVHSVGSEGTAPVSSDSMPIKPAEPELAPKPEPTQQQQQVAEKTEPVQAVKQEQPASEETIEVKTETMSGSQESKEPEKASSVAPVQKPDSDSQTAVDKPIETEPTPQSTAPDKQPAPMSYASKASPKPAPVQKASPTETTDSNAPETTGPDPEKPGQVPPKEDTAIRLEMESKAEESVDEIKTVSEVATDVKRNDVSKSEPDNKFQKSEEAAPLPVSAPAPEAGRGEPSTEGHPTTPSQKTTTPRINVLPATPISKAPTASAPKPVEAKVPTPSGKSEAKKEETVVEMPSAQTKVPKTDKPLSKPTRVSSPDGTGKAGKQTGRDNVESKTQSKTDATSQQKPVGDEKPNVIVNGNVSGASPESDSSERKDNKAKNVGNVSAPSTPRSSKKPDSKSTPDSRPVQPKETSAVKASSTEKSTPIKDSSQSEKSNGVTDKTKPTGPDLKYEDDQWSPLNPKGKRQYNSDFLLQFQYKATSLKKPEDLPNIDIVLEKPHNKIANPMQPMDYRSVGGSDFTPPYMQRNQGRQSSQGHRRVGGRAGMSGPNISGQKMPKKVVSIDRSEIELKRSANAWKPAKLDAGMKTVAEQETLDILREVRSILNKLTPSKFADLMKQVLELKIDTETKLRGVIDLIFEKAIDEPNFSEAYANMCRGMTHLRVSPDTPADSEQQAPAQVKTQVEFRKLLLTKCQREFEKNKSDQEHLLEMKTKMEENTDQSIADQLKAEYDIAESKERRRTQGNIRFIGELFKLRMLTENIMHSCIMSLFKARDDDHLESLCRLLSTIGKDLDHIKGKQRMDQYFDQIQKIVREKKTSSRVRFMLQDVQDLRLKSWVPRAIVSQGPKTIDQIHQDAKEEQELQQLKIATAPPIPPMNKGGRQGNRMGSRGHGGDDGWTKVPTSAKPTRFDPIKMKLRSNQFDESKVTLGPSQAFKGWKSGSGSSSATKTGSGSYSPSASMDRSQETGRSNTPTSMMNRFSALSAGQSTPDYDYQRRQGGRQSSREGTRSGSRGSMGPPSGGRTPRKDERMSLIETTRKMTSADRGYDARQRSRESSPSIRPRPITPQATAHKYNTDLDEEKMQKKTKSILMEFLSILDYKEATECIEELNAPPTLMPTFIQTAHELTFEKNSAARINIGKLMAHLLKRAKISVKHYIQGLSVLIESGPDYEIDFPKVWEYFSELMTPVLRDDQETEVSLTCLEQLTRPLMEANKAGNFVAELLKGLKQEMSISALKAKWQAANLQWGKLLQTNDNKVIQDFLERYNLQQLFSSGSAVTESCTKPEEQIPPASNWRNKAEEDQERYERGITKMLKSKSSNDDIFDWVESNVPQLERIKPTFIRALTTSVCKNAVDEEKKTVNKDAMTSRGLLLRKFLESDAERELSALYALQSLMVYLEQPPNILRTFCETLYDDDIISESSFYNWEKSTDPNEQEGRGVTMASANPFFTWLRSAEPESD